MKVATGKKIVNGIAMGKIRIFKAHVYEISEETAADPRREMERFEEARIKVAAQQHEL